MTETETTTRARESSDDSPRARFLAAQMRGDRAGALAVITELVASGMAVRSVHIDVIQAAQYEIGRLWETNAINIAMEHQATAIAQLALAHLYGSMPRSASVGKRVLIACVQGELHDMGARISADFLEMEGFDVCLLGASVPPASLAARVEQYRPDLIALSATMSFHLPALKDAIAHVRATQAGSVPIIVGGHAFAWSPDAAAALDVQGWGADAYALVAEARRLVLRSAT